jgi:RAB protein geranylgeranyltransferase component A
LLNQNRVEKKSYGINLNSFIFSKNDIWILDSGKTDHMIGNKNLLLNFREYDTKRYVKVVNNEMKIISDDSIRILSRIIPNVLFVENYASNLLSIRKLTNELNCKIIFLIDL